MFTRERIVSLSRPVLVLGMEGWVDAGYGASSAVAALLGSLRSDPVVSFDGDQLIDYRSRRPTLRVDDGVTAGLTWNDIALRAGSDASGNDVLLLTGPEPDMRWRAFTRAVVELVRDYGVRLAVSLGAFPAPVPHTRPVRLAATASTQELAAKVGYLPGVIELPAGIHAVLQAALDEAGIPSVGLWARVPHYVAAMPYPAAAAALVEGLASVADLTLDSGELRAAAEVTRTRIDHLIEQSSDHKRMVTNLETQADAEEAGHDLEGLGNLPTGDEIAAELERFLRGEGGSPGQGTDPGPG